MKNFLLYLALGFQSWEGLASTENWMADIYDENSAIAINTIIIPGTHNSATDEMSSQSPKSNTLSDSEKLAPSSMIKKWSKTQNNSIYQQLLDGVRYLDLRLEQTSDGIYSEHGLLSTKYSTIADDIERFAIEFPKEIIIVHFQFFHDINNLNEIWQNWENKPNFRNQIALWGDFNPKSKISDFWQKGKNVILLSSLRHLVNLDESKKVLKEFWPIVLENPWADKRNATDVESFVLNNIVSRNVNKFYVSQTIVTPDANVVTTGWLQGINSLEDMARKWMNPTFPSLLQQLNSKAKGNFKTMNIILADFYELSDLVETAIEMNIENLIAN